jgi:omega-6 fatty acid desaturase (delta-12 desaturase)
MARSDAAPYPAALTHLRPTDAAGLRVIGTAAAGTALGFFLSFAGGLGAWMCGQLLLAVMLVQWFVILHESGHDTLFRTRRWHAAAGRVAAAFSLIPYHCWVRVHGRHHKWTGWQDLDPTTEALVPRPRGRAERAIVNVCWRLWIPIFSIVYRATNYWNMPRLFRMFPQADRLAIARDTALLVALYVAVIVALGPAAALRGVGLAMIISFVIEDLLLLSQHTHVPQQVSGGSSVKPFPAVEQEPFTRSLRLPRIASAFVLHFDAHELHHMYPFVPGYHLRRIPYTPENEIGWWHWVRGAKRVSADVLLFQNRLETGHDL